MNPGHGSAISDTQVPDASKVPSYVNLARCVSGYTSLTSYTSPVRREYSPARREFTPVNGRSRRDFSPAPSHHVPIGSVFNPSVPDNRRDLSLSRLDNKENPITQFGAMYSSQLSPSKYSAQGSPCEGNDSNGRPYLKLSMLDNYNNASPTRSSRTPYRPPLHLPKSPGSNGVGGESKLGNGRLNGSSDSTNGNSSPDAVDSDIRRRVELLEKASCKNLAYNINRVSRSPKDRLDESGEDGRTFPIRKFVQTKEDKEIITLDAERNEKGSPIPVMKLLNPEFRAMLGKTAKISPNKQFAELKDVSSLAKRNENGINGNINLKAILTHETANGNSTPNKVVNINVIVSKNVNKKLDNNESNEQTLANGLMNCRNNNVQRHRELLENNINNMNIVNEGNVHRIKNDLERSSSEDSRESSKEREVLVKQVNTPVSNKESIKDVSNKETIKDNIEKSKLEIVKDSILEPILSKEEIHTHDAKETSPISKEKPKVETATIDIDDANGNSFHDGVKNEKTLCQSFIDNERTFDSLTSISEEIHTVNIPANTPNLNPTSAETSHIEPTPVVATESLEDVLVSNTELPQGSTLCPIPPSKTENNSTDSQVKDGVYYKQLLATERQVLAQFLATFESVLKEQESPEDSTDGISSDLEGQILLTVGQCKLLLNKKFPFFEKNCDKSLFQATQPLNPDSEELRILNEDLTGLWDTMYIQIDDVKDKFANLTRLRENHWVPLPADTPDTRSAIPKPVRSGKRMSLGLQKKTIPRGAASKSTSALPQPKAKNEERKKFLEEKRKAMIAEKRKEKKESEASEDLVQFL